MAELDFKNMQCISPYVLKAKHRQKQAFATEKVPCGRCPPCIKRRAAAWTFRLKQEYKICRSSAFITLTYTDAHVPVTEHGELTLKFKDTQNFMKRIRKQTRNKIKYYTVSEYGGKTERPHYHTIMFNLPEALLEPNKLGDIWGKGIIHIGECTGASIGYCTGYLQKTINLHNTDREREKSSMSKGIGQSYLTPEIIKYYRKNLLPYIVDKGGEKIPMPRYYRNKIFTESEQRTISILTQKYIEENYKENFKHQVEVKKHIIKTQNRKNRETRQGI